MTSLYSLPVKQLDYNDIKRYAKVAREGQVSTHVRLLVERAAAKEAKSINYAKVINYAKGQFNYAKGYPLPSGTVNVQ